jgi:ribosomal protein S18 acetylase RimI-like enzyme
VTLRVRQASSTPPGAWGGTVVVHGVVYEVAELPCLIAERDGEQAGVLSYHVSGGGLEIVTLEALARRGGVGTALVATACELAASLGLGRVWLVTTNDNLDALRFYQRRGFRLVGLAPGAVAKARSVKRSIPLVGEYGIPIRDELTLERIVAGSA